MSFPNFKASSTDIRWIWSNNPKVIGTGVVDTVESRVYAAGATLHSGVRIKNTSSAGTLFVGFTGGTDYMSATFVGGSGGYALGQDEEVFVEMRNVVDATVRGSAASITYTFLAH